MPAITIDLSNEDHERLRNEHNTMCKTWPGLGNGALPPTFEQWLGVRIAENEASLSEVVLDDIRIFNAIEKLIISLPQHGFGLVHIVKQGVTCSEAIGHLARIIVRDFGLQHSYAKRLEELLEHYVKDAKEIADQAQVGVTNRVYGSLSETYRHLLERSAQSVPRLGAERAIGRVEGAASILVSLEVLSREAALEKTRAFKLQARNAPKGTWVAKLFGKSDQEV